MSDKSNKSLLHNPRYINKWSCEVRYHSFIPGDNNSHVSKTLSPFLDDGTPPDFVEFDNGARRTHVLRIKVGDLMKTQRTGVHNGFESTFDQTLNLNCCRVYKDGSDFIFVFINDPNFKSNDSNKTHQDSESNHPPQPPPPPPPQP